jgi:acyl dehydratase
MVPARPLREPAAGLFGATVAHGFFTLARFTGLLREILLVDGWRPP